MESERHDNLAAKNRIILAQGSETRLHPITLRISRDRHTAESSAMSRIRSAERLQEIAVDEVHRLDRGEGA